MIIKQNEKVHIITRRLFEDDLRRHFAGEVIAASDNNIRAKGHVFVLNSSKNEFVVRPEIRERIFSLQDNALIINIIPDEVNLDNLVYKLNTENRLIVTDGLSFSLDINEFGANR